MKTTFIVLLLLAIIVIEGVCQKTNDGVVIMPYNEQNQKYSYDSIVIADNRNAIHLYSKAKEFLVEKHLDNVFVIDNNAERLVDHGSFPATFKISGIQNTYTILYSIDLSVKDDKYKFTISNFKASTNAQGTTSEVPIENFFQNSVNNGGPVAKSYGKKMNESLSQSIDLQVKKLINELTEYMISNQKSDW